MKRRTNISVQDNRGSRVTSNMHVSEEYHGYIPGDILDANMVVKLIYDALKGLSIEGHDLEPNTVGSEQIKDKSITINDLSNEVADKLNQDLNATYHAEDEVIELSMQNSNINN